MTVPNSEHLFEQADRLVIPSSSGSPRQVDLRRAISSAYYGLFHFTMASLADEFVGVTQRSTSNYVLVYRSVDHRTLKDLCADVRKHTLPRKYVPFTPVHGFGGDIEAFAAATVDLQDKRHLADYNPEPRFGTSEAQVAIATARSATMRFSNAGTDAKKAFLTLLLCPPRAPL